MDTLRRTGGGSSGRGRRLLYDLTQLVARVTIACGQQRAAVGGGHRFELLRARERMRRVSVPQKLLHSTPALLLLCGKLNDMRTLFFSCNNFSRNEI